MGQAEKAMKRLQSRPSDFTWKELLALMDSLGYDIKTQSGSSRKFIHRVTRAVLMMHQPHPAIVLKHYQVRDTLKFLRQEKHL